MCSDYHLITSTEHSVCIQLHTDCMHMCPSGFDMFEFGRLTSLILQEILIIFLMILMLLLDMQYLTLTFPSIVEFFSVVFRACKTCCYSTSVWLDFGLSLNLLKMFIVPRG